ncbi:hypothetical protein DEU56DRAFT_14744 [Suillus clintonianus]|uniref:uncharacterized protein n=1 Tax=Suillus clintonianus TaxID=1904413 RepID=UPI001B880F16|nr:uncharacterized protein DEU56DRAFT_14744 [Suillus clintonianus]KAG2157327.1 hypothetical protein DEU56DRAFT_14744 [Suillus clintonianus]
MMVEGTKRKKPPTFGHLPVNRAKKLKQAWVENTKIKSQWKAQKKREGLLQRKAEAPSNGDSPAHEEKPDVVDSEESGSSHSKDQDIDSGTHPERKQRVATNSSAGSGISLRELGKQAYSRNSLHTYKANPKRHDTKPSRGANPQRGSTMGRRGASSGDRGREKGQPNMKYRMTAMLEKIKRDFT